MSITEGVVQSLIRNDPRYAGVPGRSPWDLIVLSGQQAFQSLCPIWQDGAETFEQRYATHGADEQAQKLADNMFLELPLLVGAYRRRFTGWLQTGKPEDLIVFEGCHRILAIAIRAALNQPLPACVGVFVHG